MKLTLEAPSERQELFFRARAPFIAYGGARGGGKSWAVRQKAMMLALRYAGIQILIVRRSYPEVRENHIVQLRRLCRGLASYRETDKTLTFANESRIRFGYCATEEDADQYQGQEYDVIFIDEATQFTQMQFRMLTACLRGVNDFPKRCYLTCNPGGVGHAWVKRLFIDREYEAGENAGDYVFIPAKATDNRVMLEKNKGYLQMLDALPDDLRRAWRDGDWDALAGQYFGEFRREKHVCEPFEIPAHWRRYFAMDYGLDMLAGYWAAFDEEDRCWVYREIYEPGLIVPDAAQRILKAGEPCTAYFAPSDLWGRSADTGKSQAETFAEHGVYLSKIVAKSRVDGWMAVKDALAGERPRVQIFKNCRNLIRTLPLLQHDAHDPNDCAVQPHELTHAPDALRYLLAGRPAGEKRAAYDPFAPEYDGDEGIYHYGLEDEDTWNI